MLVLERTEVWRRGEFPFYTLASRLANRTTIVYSQSTKICICSNSNVQKDHTVVVSLKLLLLHAAEIKKQATAHHTQ
jgi:hypothetical protein